MYSLGRLYTSPRTLTRRTVSPDDHVRNHATSKLLNTESTRQSISDSQGICETAIQTTHLHTHMNHSTCRQAFASRLQVSRSASAHMEKLRAWLQAPHYDVSSMQKGKGEVPTPLASWLRWRGPLDTRR